MTGLLHSLAHAAETRLDRVRHALRDELGLRRQLMIAPFRSFGTIERFRVFGRVIEDQGVAAAPRSDRLLDNLLMTFRRYETNEAPGATVLWRFGDAGGSAVTDEEGFFSFDVERAPAPGWQTVRLTLDLAGLDGQAPVGAEVQSLVPDPSAAFGIISDIDDTIVKTGATNLLRHWRTVVANAAEDRVPFRGLAPFYRALQEGRDGKASRPVFYVSSSPWNLHDLFERFMAIHEIPLGAMLLKDWGLDATKWATGSHDDHKIAAIERIFATYPALAFILIGDSGQRDAEIYAAIARRHPTRVVAVYIRDVTEAHRDTAAKRILEDATRDGVRTAYGPDLREAAADAVAAGWIEAAALGSILAAIEDPDRPGA